jgi:Ca-activated chloride channel homolog
MIFLDYDPLYQALWSAAVLLSILLLAWAWIKRGIRAGLAFPMARFKGHGIRKNWRAKIAHAPFLLRIVSIVCVLIALARPQVPQEETAEVEGIDIVVAFDLSGSMISVDISDEKLIELQNEGKEPDNRFNIATAVLKDFIQSRQYDRVSLVIFGKEAFLQFPLTLDYGVMLKILDQMELGDIDGTGTAIGNALAMSLSRLKESEAKSKLIILLTDGEDNGSNISPLQLAEEAKKRGIPIFPILVGTDDQSWQPTEMVDMLTGQRRYQQVDNKVNPSLLKEIASKTQGRFYRASDPDSLKEDFQDILNAFEKSRLVDYAVAERAELFPYFIWATLCLVLLEQILSQMLLRRYP